MSEIILSSDSHPDDELRNRAEERAGLVALFLPMKKKKNEEEPKSLLDPNWFPKRSDEK